MSVTYSGDYTQWGNSATATNNFVLKVPAAPDGTIALYRGNYGAESATIFSVSAAGAFAPVSLLDLSGAAAGQIKFPATQNASADANTLDDYEEGTWVPVFGGLTVVGTPTYTGTYTKIGNVVNVCITVSSTTSTASTYGGTILDNLPFIASKRAVFPTIVDATGASSLSVAEAGTNNMYMGAWAASASVFISGSYLV